MRRKIWSADDLNQPSVRTDETTGSANSALGLAGGEGGTQSILAAAAPSPAAAGGEGSPTPSDARLKEDVRQIGRTKHGLPLYRFRYRGGDEVFAGVMAQDVIRLMPAAVSVGADGFYRVDYPMLGIAMERVN